MNISVCCPSYKRPSVKTLAYLPFCKVYVDGSEFDAYKAANPKGSNIVKCPDGVQGNVARVRNHILDAEFQAGADAVALVDDDMRDIGYYAAHKTKISLPSADVMPFLEAKSLMAQEWGARFWGVNINPDPQSFHVYVPFSTLSFIGGPFGVFLRGNECRYDERLPLKEDYDMTLQQLDRYRLVVRFNKFFYRVKQSDQAGGCAAYRNLESERQQLELLQRKWGKKIVRIDMMDRNHKTDKKRIFSFDYNPIIKAPIRGL